jgi:hypothetical protein
VHCGTTDEIEGVEPTNRWQRVQSTALRHGVKLPTIRGYALAQLAAMGGQMKKRLACPVIVAVALGASAKAPAQESAPQLDVQTAIAPPPEIATAVHDGAFLPSTLSPRVGTAIASTTLGPVALFAQAGPNVLRVTNTTSVGAAALGGLGTNL